MTTIEKLELSQVGFTQSVTELVTIANSRIRNGQNTAVVLAWLAQQVVNVSRTAERNQILFREGRQE